jgi:hypothetical protein
MRVQSRIVAELAAIASLVFLMLSLAPAQAMGRFEPLGAAASLLQPAGYCAEPDFVEDEPYPCPPRRKVRICDDRYWDPDCPRPITYPRRSDSRRPFFSPGGPFGNDFFWWLLIILGLVAVIALIANLARGPRTNTGPRPPSAPPSWLVPVLVGIILLLLLFMFVGNPARAGRLDDCIETGCTWWGWRR